MSLLSQTEWDEFLRGHSEAHILQCSTWGALKDGFGWKPERVRVGECGAQVLFRRLPMGLSVAYLPKGPVGKGWTDLWPALDALCRKRGAIFLRVEPDAWEPETAALAEQLKGFSPAQTIQPRRTVLVDLRGGEEALLARMKQKTRYNIRLSERKGVSVRSSADLAAFQRLMVATGARDGFGVHSEAYYRRAYDLFHPGGQCELLAAEFDGCPLAMLMVFAAGNRAWYLYGASSDEERNRMPTYLLQWEAMRWAIGKGCTEYDLWGIPDEDAEDLEAGFSERGDGLWGVYRFKRGFGGEVRRSAGAWEKVYNPTLYRLYRWYSSRRSGEGV